MGGHLGGGLGAGCRRGGCTGRRPWGTAPRWAVPHPAAARTGTGDSRKNLAAARIGTGLRRKGSRRCRN